MIKMNVLIFQLFQLMDNEKQAFIYLFFNSLHLFVRICFFFWGIVS